MLHSLLAGLTTAAVMTTAVVLTGIVGPGSALHRLTPVVVGTLSLDSSPGSATFAVSNMAPGDVAVRSLTIANGGTLPFRYAMGTAVDADASLLASQLTVALHEAVDGGCAGERGAVIAGPATAVALAFGSAAWGQQDGDRRLDVGASEVLCFVVALPLSATSAVADASTALEFTFDAEEIRAE